MSQMQLLQGTLSLGDVVYTPDWCAKDMVNFFQPSGKVLDPCKGEGAIFRYLPKGSDWCEISEGRDFFAWNKKVDWIIANPPYDNNEFLKWLEHSFYLAPDIVFLLPVHFIFRSGSRVDFCRKSGWIKHVRWYGNGSKLDFPFSNPVAAVHFVRGYHGDTSWSWYAPQ